MTTGKIEKAAQEARISNRLATVNRFRLWGTSAQACVVIVAVQTERSEFFDWPEPNPHNPPTGCNTLHDMMAARGWRGADDWAKSADEMAPIYCRRI